MEEKALATRGTGMISQKQAMYLLRTIWKDAPDTEVIKAAILCRQYNLNPLMGHIYLIKYDRYQGKGQERRKVGEDWSIVRGIRSKRIMAQQKKRYSYKTGPRIMTEAEQQEIFGEVEPEKLWAICVLKDADGNEYPGYGFWWKDTNVMGSDKGNSPRNMAFIHAESNALDKLAPGELPDIGVVDESYVTGDFQTALQEGKAEFQEAVKEDIEEFWPEGTKIESGPFIDLIWLKESLQELQGKGLTQWSNASMVNRINNVTGHPAKSVTEAVSFLNKGQAHVLITEIMNALKGKQQEYFI